LWPASQMDRVFGSDKGQARLLSVRFIKPVL
jgi:hypothetical protein